MTEEIMQAFEPAPDPQARAKEIRDELYQLYRASPSVLRARLARAHPWHVTRIARGVFMVATVLSLLVLIASVALPLTFTEAARFMAEVERGLPLPFFVLTVVLTLCMAVAWVTAGQAALAIARECKLLPWEDEQRRKLEGQLSALEGSSGFVQSDHPDDGPPGLMMPESRLSSDLGRGPQATPGGTLRYADEASGWNHRGASHATPPSGYPRTTPHSGRPRVTPPGAPRHEVASRDAYSGPMKGFGTPTPARGSTASGAPYRSDSGLSYREPSAPPAGGRASTTPSTEPSAPARGRNPADPPSADTARAPMGGYVIGIDETTDHPGDDYASQQASWKGPRFAEVDEPWLRDALRKAQQLARRYPVQAFLEYSVEPDLPFTLILERATPAMAVRAMVEFVNFLASISTPRRARIELRSVVHLDRSFYRSVMSAMEPYFPDSVEITQQGYRVEIVFLEPDPHWGRHPILPLENA